ncbi:MAG: hypothetical protein HGA51_07050, partial [Demequinaceae bacterium]|nr:hypothetical protein [Demequinaceae bacterium]
DVPTTNPFAPPARPWSTVDPAEVEFVGGEALAVEVGAFGAELPGPLEAPEDAEAPDVFAPAAPSWEGIIGGTTEPAPMPASYEAPVAVTPGQFPPVTDQEAAPAEASAGEFDTVSAENDFRPDLDGPAAGSDETDASAPVSSDDAPGVDGDALLESDAHPVVDVPAAPPALPMTPAASFFAATAARNARRADDLENPLSALLPNDEEPDESPTEEAAPAEASASVDAPTDVFVLEPPAPDTLRAEPVHTTATAYTPSTGEWARPAFAASDAVTEVNGMERIGDTTEMGAPAAQSAANAETGGPSAVEVTTRKTHRRRRLVLWIVLAAVIAAGAGVLAYRLFFLPEPITLPVPTTTAPAPTPTAEPMEITDPSDFVAAMPTTVGTNVLVSYEVKSTVGDTTLPARTAEQVTLTYGQGSSSQVFTVDAYQHYNEDDAKTTYDAFAAGATDVEDVTVNGTTVGQRAYSTTGSTGTLVWRNGTAVFSLAGPSDEVLDFYEHFGI